MSNVFANIARLHQVGASIAAIRMFYELGVRYITLTHACDNPFATSCSTVVNGAPDRGLSQIGISAIHEMNRLGPLLPNPSESYPSSSNHTTPQSGLTGF